MHCTLRINKKPHRNHSQEEDREPSRPALVSCRTSKVRPCAHMATTATTLPRAEEGRFLPPPATAQPIREDHSSANEKPLPCSSQFTPVDFLFTSAAPKSPFLSPPLLAAPGLPVVLLERTCPGLPFPALPNSSHLPLVEHWRFMFKVNTARRPPSPAPASGMDSGRREDGHCSHLEQVRGFINLIKPHAGELNTALKSQWARLPPSNRFSLLWTPALAQQPTLSKASPEALVHGKSGSEELL